MTSACDITSQKVSIQAHIIFRFFFSSMLGTILAFLPFFNQVVSAEHLPPAVIKHRKANIKVALQDSKNIELSSKTEESYQPQTSFVLHPILCKTCHITLSSCG